MGLQMYRKTLETLPPSNRKEFLQGQLDKVTAVLNGTPSNRGTSFYSSGVQDLPPTQLDENAWSSRLAGALNDYLPAYLSGAVEYTAEDGPKFPIKQMLKSGIPNISHLVSCYPFKGTPDLTVKNTPFVIGETNASGEETTSASGASASGARARATGSDGETSGEECDVGCGKQADPLSSPQPQKLGELNANMHISLVQKTMRMFRLKPNKAKSRKEVKTSGLYLHKCLGGYVCRMSIPVIEIKLGPAQQAQAQGRQQASQSMNLSLEQLAFGHLTIEQLCFCLKRLLNKDMHA